MNAPAPSNLRSQSWNAVMTASPGALDLSVAASDIEGSVPEALRGGRLLSNGPGWTRIGGRVAHPFDGHGYVRAFDFLEDGGVRLTARFVETKSYVAERAAGKMVHRGFATNVSDRFYQNIGFSEPRNVANTTIVRWGGQLLAGWEGGRPYALDPETLETRGEEDFGGAIEGQATLAHLHCDHGRDRLVLCSLQNGRNTRFTFREIDRDHAVVSSAVAEVEGMVFSHDFALTPSAYVLGGNPLRMKLGELAKMAAGSGTLLRAVTPDLNKPGCLHLIDRETGALRTVSLPGPAFVVHFGNAFERDGDVFVDACVFSKFEFGEEFGYTGPHGPFDPTLPDRRGPQALVRITVPKGASEATWRPLTEQGVDFPRFHPHHEARETPVMFGATRKDTRYSDPFDSILRVELTDPEAPESMWTAPDHVFVGEPIVAPADESGKTGGHVMALLSDGLRQETTLVVFEADGLARGPVASVKLPLLPVAFHGEWDPAA